MTPRLVAIFVIGLQMAACTVGSGPPGVPGPGGDPGDGPDGGVVPPEDLLSGAVELSVGSLPESMTLGSSESIEVVVTSLDDYAGGVELSLVGAPASWTVSISPASLTLAAGEVATAELVITVPSNGDAASANLQVTATALAQALDGVAVANSTVAVDNRVYYRVPAGTSAGTHVWPSGSIRPGTTVVFINGDSLVHKIHSNNDDVGFPHQDPDSLLPAAPTSTYEVTITESGSYSFYCHIHGDGSGTGAIVVE